MMHGEILYHLWAGCGRATADYYGLLSPLPSPARHFHPVPNIQKVRLQAILNVLRKFF
jgi:hypothetical protein